MLFLNSLHPLPGGLGCSHGATVGVPTQRCDSVLCTGGMQLDWGSLLPCFYGRTGFSSLLTSAWIFLDDS